MPRVHTNVVKIEVYGNRTIGSKKIKNAVDAANNPVNQQNARNELSELRSDTIVPPMTMSRTGGQRLRLGPTTIRIENLGRVSLTEHHREPVQKSAFRDYYLGRGRWDRARAQRDGVDIDRLNLLTLDVEHVPEGQLHMVYAHLKAFLESQRGFCVVSGLPGSTRTSRTGIGWRTNQVRLEDQEINRIVTAPLSRGGSTTNSEASSEASETSSEADDARSDSSGDTVRPAEAPGEPVVAPQEIDPGREWYRQPAAPQEMGGYEPPREPAVQPLGRPFGERLWQAAVAPQELDQWREAPRRPAVAGVWDPGRPFEGFPGQAAAVPEALRPGRPPGELADQPVAVRAEMDQGRPRRPHRPAAEMGQGYPLPRQDAVEMDPVYELPRQFAGMNLRNEAPREPAPRLPDYYNANNREPWAPPSLSEESVDNDDLQSVISDSNSASTRRSERSQGSRRREEAQRRQVAELEERNADLQRRLDEATAGPARPLRELPFQELVGEAEDREFAAGPAAPAPPRANQRIQRDNAPRRRARTPVAAPRRPASPPPEAHDNVSDESDSDSSSPAPSTTQASRWSASTYRPRGESAASSGSTPAVSSSYRALGFSRSHEDFLRRKNEAYSAAIRRGEPPYSAEIHRDLAGNSKNYSTIDAFNVAIRVRSGQIIKDAQAIEVTTRWGKNPSPFNQAYEAAILRGSSTHQAILAGYNAMP